jgi:hypothetical protein
MLRALLAVPPRLASRGAAHASLLRAAPAAAARLVARPLASPSHVSGIAALLRALSTGAPPAAPATVPSAAVAPKRAAELRVLSVLGVVEFAKRELYIDSDDYEKLVKQKIDGATLLEMSVDELCDRCGLSTGAAHTIMRGIAPAVAEVQAAVAEMQAAAAKVQAAAAEAQAAAVAEAQAAAAEASVITLKIFPPLKAGGGRNNPVMVKLTPAAFVAKYVASGSPLQLVSKDGAVLEEFSSLKDAAAASRHPTAHLRWTRSFGDDVDDLRGFVENAAEALEQETTRALASDAGLARAFGPLAAVNAAEHFTVSRRGRGKLLQKMEIDGLVVGATAVLLNSTKHKPTLKHVDDAVADAEKLRSMLLLHESLSTKPPDVKDVLACVAHLRVVPFLSGNNFSAAVEAKCFKKCVGIVRSSGAGFVVAAPAEAPAAAGRASLSPPPARPLPNKEW